MGFETVVLGRVEEILGTPSRASFTNGTLFVSDLCIDEAKFIKESLMALTPCRIDFNKVGSEFAFDFI